MSIIYPAIVLCAFGLIGIKADLRILIDEVQIAKCDPEWFDPKKTTASVEEDSDGVDSITTSITLVKQAPDDVQGHLKLLGLSMGKYILSTGVDVDMGLCDMFDEPIIMEPFLTGLGFSADDCPPSAGTYYRQGYTLPMDNMPSDFPDNKYLAIFEIIIKNKPVLVTKFFVDIQT